MSQVTSARKSEAIAKAEGASSEKLYAWLESLVTSHAEFRDQVVADLGAGRGHFARRLDAKQVVAYDALPKPLDVRAIEWREVDLETDWHLDRRASFDTVFAIEVIEHLENFRLFIRKAASILKPGGRLIVTTPNVRSARSLISLIARGQFVDFLDSSYPAHLTPVVATDLARALREAELEIETELYSPWGTMPKLTSLSWQRATFGLARGWLFSDHVLMIGRKR